MFFQTKVNIPHHEQKNTYYCGPAVLQMVFEHFKKHVPQDEIAKQAKTGPEDGTFHEDMIRVSTEHGFHVYVNNHSTFFEIKHFLEKGLPVIVNFIEPSNDDGHYAVISGFTLRKVVLNDPWNGKNFKLLKKDFLDRWHDSKNIHKEWIMVIAENDFHLGKQYSPKK